MYSAQPAEESEHTICQRAATKTLLTELTPHMRKKCLQFALRYLHGSFDGWKRSCRLMNIPFSASPATNK